MIPILPIALGARKFLAGIPREVWYLLAACLLLWGFHHHGVKAGEKRVQAKWDSAVEREAKQAAKKKAAQGAVSVRVETKYVDRVRIVREVGATIIKEVPIYVPATACPLPGGWRLLHDAAAAGSLPDPSRLPDAAPVPAQAAASTVAGNYATCHETEARLSALQDWVRDQEKVTNK